MNLDTFDAHFDRVLETAKKHPFDLTDLKNTLVKMLEETEIALTGERPVTVIRLSPSEVRTVINNPDFELDDWFMDEIASDVQDAILNTGYWELVKIVVSELSE